MNHKEMTAHIRDRIKKAGIKADIRKSTACRVAWIKVTPRGYDVYFSDEEQVRIRTIAKANGLTLVQGMEIEIDQNTDPHGMDFVFHAA